MVLTMPLFDYECPTCGSREEDVLVSGEPAEVLPCPNQCPEGMGRLPTVPVVHFRGYGFTPKFHHRGLRAEWKSAEDTVEENSNGQLVAKTGAGHDAPGR